MSWKRKLLIVETQTPSKDASEVLVKIDSQPTTFKVETGYVQKFINIILLWRAEKKAPEVTLPRKFPKKKVLITELLLSA